MLNFTPKLQLLRACGIEFNENLDPFFSEETFETKQKGLYLAGVVQGGLNTSKLFIENTRNHGEVIIQHILTVRN